MSFVEAAGGKSQRKFGGVTRDIVIKLGQATRMVQRWIGTRVKMFQLVRGRRVHDVCTGKSRKSNNNQREPAEPNALRCQRRADVSGWCCSRAGIDEADLVPSARRCRSNAKRTSSCTAPKTCGRAPTPSRTSANRNSRDCESIDGGRSSAAIPDNVPRHVRPLAGRKTGSDTVFGLAHYHRDIDRA
jgi:hypothetical protein